MRERERDLIDQKPELFHLKKKRKNGMIGNLTNLKASLIRLVCRRRRFINLKDSSGSMGIKKKRELHRLHRRGEITSASPNFKK